MKYEEECLKQKTRSLNKEKVEFGQSTQTDPVLTKKQKQQIKKKKQKKKKLMDNNKVLIEQMQNAQDGKIEDCDRREELENQSEMLSYPKNESQENINTSPFNIYSRKNLENGCLTGIKNDLYGFDLNKRMSNEDNHRYESNDNPNSEEMESRMYYDKIKMLCHLHKKNGSIKFNSEYFTENEFEKPSQSSRVYNNRFDFTNEPMTRNNNNSLKFKSRKIENPKRNYSLNIKLSESTKRQRINFGLSTGESLPRMRPKSCYTLTNFGLDSKRSFKLKKNLEFNEKGKSSVGIQEGDIKDIQVVYKKTEIKKDGQQSNFLKYTVNFSDPTNLMMLIESVNKQESGFGRYTREDRTELNNKRMNTYSSIIQYVN